jgi:hypothetical protein
VLATAAVVLVAACDDRGLSNPSSAPPGPRERTVVGIAVRPDAPGAYIAPDFLGLGFEMGVLREQRFAGDASLERLLTNLGPGTLRFGGNSVERTRWATSGARSTSSGGADDTLVVQAADFDRVIAFARRVGWRVVVALNLGAFDPERGAAEAAMLVRRGGRTLLGIEVGNEPDLYALNGVRSRRWSPDSLRVEFRAYTRAIRVRAPDVRIAGPATWCGAGPSWLPAFLRDEGAGLTLATHHIYPMSATAPPTSPEHATIANMLSARLMARTAACVDGAAAAARARGLPLRIDESNSAYGFGKRGVSDVVASALWGVDHLFTLAEHGASGVNLQAGTNVRGGLTCAGIYLPVCGSRGSYTARPLYYAMLFFHHAARGRLVPVDVAAGGVNVAAHAALADDGTLRVALVNKDLTRPFQARIAPGRGYARAEALRLAGPRLDATDGMTFGGAAVAADGSWAPEAVEPVFRSGAAFSVSLPVAHAVLVTFRPGP